MPDALLPFYKGLSVGLGSTTYLLLLIATNCNTFHLLLCYAQIISGSKSSSASTQKSSLSSGSISSCHISQSLHTLACKRQACFLSGDLSRYLQAIISILSIFINKTIQSSRQAADFGVISYSPPAIVGSPYRP